MVRRTWSISATWLGRFAIGVTSTDKPSAVSGQGVIWRLLTLTNTELRGIFILTSPQTRKFIMSSARWRRAQVWFPPIPQELAMGTDVRGSADSSQTVRSGRRRGTYHMSRDLLSAAGFVDVEITTLSIPLSPVDNALGKLWLVACLLGIEAGSLRLLTKYSTYPHLRNLLLDPTTSGRD